MRPNFNNMNNNYNINNMMRWLYVLSFIVQWSIISMILNLFTLGLIQIPLFIVFILDALSMIIIKQENKTLRKPSFILSKIWDIIEYITRGRQGNYNNTNNFINSIYNLSDKIRNTFQNISDKFQNIKNNINKTRQNNKKYNIERELNKFSPEIGDKITIESIKPGEKLEKKKFKYRDRAISYIKILESNGYADYTKYNINLNLSPAYIIINKERDLVDIDSNKIKLKHDTNDYHYVIDGWPQ